MPYELTNKEHVERKGAACPYCESNEIDGVGNTEQDGNGIWVDMRCNLCGSEWSDFFKLAVYSGADPVEQDTKVLKTFESGKVAIVETEGGKAVVLEYFDTSTKNTRAWFTRLDSPRIKRIKGKKIKEEVKQALTEIAIIEKLDPK